MLASAVRSVPPSDLSATLTASAVHSSEEPSAEVTTLQVTGHGVPLRVPISTRGSRFCSTRRALVFKQLTFSRRLMIPALGAGGRAFKSPRPDQWFQLDMARNRVAKNPAVDKIEDAESGTHHLPGEIMIVQSGRNDGGPCASDVRPREHFVKEESQFKSMFPRQIFCPRSRPFQS